jgi:hypothetical protein
MGTWEPRNSKLLPAAATAAVTTTAHSRLNFDTFDDSTDIHTHTLHKLITPTPAVTPFMAGVDLNHQTTDNRNC